MGLYRALVVLFGALPATVLGSLAIGVMFGGLRSLASGEFSGVLFFVWGVLGLAGVAGLWLAVIEGPHAGGAASLIACGVIAEAVLIGLTVRGGLFVWHAVAAHLHGGRVLPPRRVSFRGRDVVRCAPLVWPTRRARSMMTELSTGRWSGPASPAAQRRSVSRIKAR